MRATLAQFKQMHICPGLWDIVLFRRCEVKMEENSVSPEARCCLVPFTQAANPFGSSARMYRARKIVSDEDGGAAQELSRWPCEWRQFRLKREVSFSPPPSPAQPPESDRLIRFLELSSLTSFLGQNNRSYPGIPCAESRELSWRAASAPKEIQFWRCVPSNLDLLFVSPAQRLLLFSPWLPHRKGPSTKKRMTRPCNLLLPSF